jgi:hypothetical protein
MKSENEIREKISSLMDMESKARRLCRDSLGDQVALQIDILLWVVGDEGGLPPLDEDGMYSFYNGVVG